MKKLLISLFLLSVLSGCAYIYEPKFDLFDKVRDVFTREKPPEPAPYKPVYDLDIALNILGYHERDNREELEDILRVDPVRVPWCAAFVAAILRESNVPTTESFLARSYLKWGVEVEEPLYGDILVFERGTEDWQGHVGFFIGKYGDDHFMVLGGNQANSVSIKIYTKEKLIGIRRYIP